MGDIFDRWRLNRGWNPWPDDTQMMAIASFIQSLDLAEVPVDAYLELYEKVLQARATALQGGKQVPEFGVELMLACWPTLREEMQSRQISSVLMLTTTSQTNCLRCYGTGWENIVDDDGVRIGVKPGCMHEHIDESDPHNAGMAEAQAAIKFVAKAETAVDICRRVQQQLSYIVVTAIGDEGQEAWDASRTWVRAERYCRENGE